MSHRFATSDHLTMMRNPALARAANRFSKS
jgi:hypothetical protein